MKNETTSSIFVLFLCAVYCLIVAGCSDKLDKALAHIDTAILTVDRQSSEWRSSLETLGRTLPDDAKKIINNDLQRLTERSLAAATSNVMCVADFVPRRVSQGLRNLRAKLTGKAIEPSEPSLCSVSPQAFDLYSRELHQSTIQFNGYDFDQPGSNGTLVQVVLVQGNGQRVTVPERLLGRTTHYQLTLNAAEAEFRTLLCQNPSASKVALYWNGRPLSAQSEVVVQRIPRDLPARSVALGAVDYTPPHTRGDRDFDTDDDDPMVVQVTCTTRISSDRRQILADVTMFANEPRPDHTTAQGSRTGFVCYTAPDGHEIISVSPLGQSSVNERINRHGTVNYSRPSGEAVSLFAVDGDFDDDEAGTRTKVHIRLSSVNVVLRPMSPCR